MFCLRKHFSGKTRDDILITVFLRLCWEKLETPLIQVQQPPHFTNTLFVIESIAVGSKLYYNRIYIYSRNDRHLLYLASKLISGALLQVQDGLHLTLLKNRLFISTVPWRTFSTHRRFFFAQFFQNNCLLKVALGNRKWFFYCVTEKGPLLEPVFLIV